MMIWIIHNTWKEKDKALDVKQFKRIGEKAYEKFPNEIYKFVQNKKQDS